MTVLFSGTEREVLVQGGGGTYLELASSGGIYSRSAYARAGSEMIGDGTYDIPFAAPVDELWFSCHGHIGSGAGVLAPAVALVFMDAADNVIARINSNNDVAVQLAYWNGAAFVTVGAFTANLNASPPFRLDVHVKKHATAGEVALYVNELLHARAVGVNTASFGQITKAQFRQGIANPMVYSEVIAATENTQGWNLYTCVPSADGTDTDGIGAVTDINELNKDTTTFVQFDTAGEKRSVVHAALTIENFIKSVTVTGTLRRVDDTGPQKARPYVIVGGVRYYGTTFALTTGFLNYQYIWNISPASGTDWTTAEINAPEFEMGWEAVA